MEQLGKVINQVTKFAQERVLFPLGEKWETVLGSLDATPKVPWNAGFPRVEHRGSRTTSSEPHLPSWSRQENRFPYFVWKGFPAFPAHLRMMLVSRGNSRWATWVVPHAEWPRFPGPLLKWTRCPDTSLKETLWGKAQHEGALTPPCGKESDTTEWLNWNLWWFHWR